MPEKVFYSWQSDSPNSTNRGFIQTALEKAVQQIRNDESITVDPVVDRDTQNLSGSPDISASIFEKIDAASVFVCDVSLINTETTKPTPNPNVLIELGYAAKSLGWTKIIMVMNTSFGDVNYLPFDLRHRRITQYCVTKAEQPKSDKKNRLQKILVDALRAIFEENLSVSVIEPVPSFINQDKVLFEELLEALPSAGSIQFINENNMAGFSFDPARLNDLYKFAEEWKDAEHEFLDEELEQDRQHLHSLIQQYLYEIAKNTFSVGGGGLQSVPEEWEITQPKRFSDTVQLLHSLAGEIVDAHQAFIRKGRRKFSV